MNASIIFILVALVLVGLVVAYYLFVAKKRETNGSTDSANLDPTKNKEFTEELLIDEADSSDLLSTKQKEISKLKMKVKHLEEDIEDIEEEYEEDLERQRRQSLSQINELDEALDEQKKCLLDCQQKLDENESQLKEMKREYELKQKTLQFTEKILRAKSYSGSENDQASKTIERVRLLLKNYCNFLVSYSKNCKENLKYQDEISSWTSLCDRWASEYKKSWTKGKIAVSFIGDFSAGKTSIVNRILTADDPDAPKLPVHTRATTAIPTYISGGEPNFLFVAPDDTIKIINRSVFLEVKKELLDQIKGISSLIKYFVFTYKNKHLDNLSLLDTPGFSSNDDEDTSRTLEVINESDALFWVFDVNNGTINRKSIELIKEKLSKPLYVIINKVDTKAKSEVDQVEALIKKEFIEAEVEVQQILRFSKDCDISDIMTAIHSVKRTACTQEFLSNLKEAIEAYRKDCIEELTKRSRILTKNSAIIRNLNERIEIIIKSLINESKNIKEMHSRKSKFWGLVEDYYMSKSDYKELKKQLETLPTSMSELEKKIKDLQKVTKTETEIMGEKSIYRRYLLDIHFCYTEICKIEQNT